MFTVVSFSFLRAWWFRVVSLVSQPALGLLCGVFVLLNLLRFWNFAEISQIWRLLFGAFEKRSAFIRWGKRPSGRAGAQIYIDLGGGETVTQLVIRAPKKGGLTKSIRVPLI